MRSQRTVFTALPNGLVPDQPGKYRLSVHIAPQLRDDVDSQLSLFPDWAEWPKTVNAIGWSVSFGGGPPIPATVASAPAQNGLWTALFKGGALVRSHTPPPVAGKKVYSYPARNVMAFIQKHYTDIAIASPDDYPHIDDLMISGPFGLLPVQRLKEGMTTPYSGMGEVESTIHVQKAYTNGPPLTKVLSDFYQLYRFHQPRVRSNQDLPALPPVPKPKLDFHEVVSSAGQYPPLLRLLGLVVDLIIDVGQNPPSTPNDVRVVPAWTPKPPGIGTTADIVTPRTRCLIDGGQFRARPRAVDPELVDGRLPLNDTDRYTLLQVDQDGAGLKAIDFAGNLTRFVSGRSVASPDRYALPSLRSGGMAVSRINRAVGLVQRIGRSAEAAGELAKPTPGQLFLDAEDVTRGHRVDIRDTREAKWFSLAARTGTYHFPGGVDVPFTDEGWTTAAVTEDDMPEKNLYLQETLFRWGGWSLSAPRPGGRLATTQVEEPPVTTDPVAPDPDFPVTVDAKATPGSLPRLRFGRTYEVRARAVDLAGNSDPLDPAVEDRRKTPPADYLRFEPVQSPPVLPYGPRTEGESVERVVLRSNHDRPPARDVIVARHIVPPKASQLLAEQHGLFDTAYPNSKVDAATYTTISKYVLPTPPAGPVLQSEQGSFFTSSEGVQDEADHAKVRYFPVELVTLPYLPDPMARGASLVFVDHPQMSPNEQLQAEFRAQPAWPAHQPVRLVVREGDAKPAYNGETHQIDVPLGKADVVHVRLSAYLPRERVDEMGIWGWIKAGGGGSLLTKIVEGRHWMTTPYRLITLVHAVRQPLAIAMFPKLGNSPLFSALKKPGDTFVTFSGLLQFSRKSTSRVDVVAEWGEYTDLGPGQAHPTAPKAAPPVAPAARRTVPFSVPGDRPGPGANAQIKPETDRQEFGDTRHRRVSYTTIATTRFSEYFVETKDVVVAYGGDLGMVIPLSTDSKGVVPGSVKVKNKVLADKNSGKVEGVGNYAEGRHYHVNAEEGVVVLDPQAPGAPKNGTALTISYLVPPLVRPGPGETMEPVVLSIKSSAPPAAPKVVYVVPTFGWESKHDPIFGTRESRRLGKGLRVYLERPWWSSGEGELLAAILDNPNSEPSEVRAKLVTRAGVDPLYKSTGTTPFVSLASFPNAKVAGIGPNGSGLTAPGVPGTVFASGHEVNFDKERDLWFCDMTINTTSYFPFVKLGLARFQPESVNGMHLSPIVVTDFCQLAPDRFVTVTPVMEPGPPGRRTVTVTGQSYEKAGGDTVPPLVRVSVERLEPNVGDSELGWTVVGKPEDLERQPNQGNDSVWRGRITVPKAPNGTKQRLVIEEYERHRTGASPVFGQRLVYSDIIEL